MILNRFYLSKFASNSFIRVLIKEDNRPNKIEKKLNLINEKSYMLRRLCSNFMAAYLNNQQSYFTKQIN